MSNLKISIIGYGKMGKEIEKIANEKGIEICSIIDPNNKGIYKEISEDSVKNADVCIDFTNPGVVIENIKKLYKLNKKIVVGTTGWYDNLNELRNNVDQSKIGLIYSSNFSMGVNLFYKIISNSSSLFKNFSEYDIFCYELHHKMKLDQPSGTAKSIKSIIKDETGKEINFLSVRSGYIPGTHVVGFDSDADTIEIKHTARNRSGFALGAILAAIWINDKKGIFEFKDILNELLEVKNEI